jgi:hypothetical protein
MNKYELALVVSAKIDDDARTAVVDKAKAIRMAEDMLAERKGYVKDFVGGTISVMCKETKEEVWSKLIEEV